MIARVFRGTGFAGLQSYLLRGRDGRDTERVLWTATRNLAIDDPEHAAPVMRATTEQSERVEKPVWHLALAAEPGAELDRERWERIADRLLEDLGLEQHQVLLVAHGDTKHPHIHLMVNRVHPVEHRAWSTSHDYRRIERALRYIERDFGLREVPGNLYRFDATPAPDRTTSKTPGEVREIRRTGEPSWGDRARAALRPEFRDARSWADLRGRLQAHGYRLEPRGRGLVVTDGKRSIKASRIARSVSAHRLASRFGQTYPEWSRARHDTLTAATEVRTAGELLAGAQRRAAVGERLARSATEAHATLREVRLRNAETTQRLLRDLGTTYRDPPAARRAVVRHARRHGWIATAQQLETRPASFGDLRGARLAPRRREVRTAAYRAAHSARQLAHLRPRRARLVSRAHKARRDYRLYERRTAARRQARVARSRYLAAQRNLAAAARRGTKDLAAALPAEARRAVHAALRVTQSPKRTVLGTATGRMIPRVAATAALAFGASALRFALSPNPLTAGKVAGAGARALRELGRDSEASRGR